jgi:hemoglobin/transferrin/lactoferrin receptor protein
MSYKNKPIHYRSFSRITLATVCLTNLAFAQEQDPESIPVSLSETTLVGEVSSTPEFVSTNAGLVDSEALQEWSATDLEDIFKTTPSVRVGGANVQAQKIYVRNLEDTLLNVTIDGAPQVGNLFHHQGRINVEPELLKQVEITAGTGNALSGPGALGGAIAFETVNGFDMLEEGKSFGGIVKGVAYSNGEGGKGSLTAYGLINENWSYLLSGSYTDRDDYEDGDGHTVEHTGYDRTSVLAKTSGFWGEDNMHSLDVSYEYFKDNTRAFNRVNYIPFTFGSGSGPLQDYDFERNTGTVKYGLNPVDIEWLNLSSTAYYTQQKFTREEVYNVDDTLTGATVDTVGMDLRNSTLFTDVFEITYGFDYRQDTGKVVNKNNSNNHADVRNGKDETLDVAGLYTQAVWEVNPILTLTSGVRFDSYDYEDRLNQHYSDDGFSPNFGAEIRPLTGLTLSGSYSEALRGVGMPELFLNGPARGSGSAPAVQNAADIDAEKAKNLEFSAEYVYSAYFVKGTVFKQKIDDFISPTNSSSGYRENVGDFESKGYEISTGARYNALTAEIGFSYTDPRLEGESTTEVLGLAVATGDVWFGNFEYFFESINLTTGWHVEFVDTYNKNGVEKKSTIVHDAFVRWESEQFSGLSIGVTINNVFDKQYVDQSVNGYANGLGMPSSGRDMSLSVAYKF